HLLRNHVEVADCRARRAAEVVDVRAVDREIARKLANHPLDFPIAGHRAVEHVLEDLRCLRVEREVGDLAIRVGEDSIESHGVAPAPVEITDGVVDCEENAGSMRWMTGSSALAAAPSRPAGRARFPLGLLALSSVLLFGGSLLFSLAASGKAFNYHEA